MFNVQGEITPKVGKPELPFMCPISRLLVLYICVKFHENIERTQVHSRNGYFQYLLCSKGCNSKSMLTRVTVFVFCMLSPGALHLRNLIIISQTVFNLQSRREHMVEMAMFNVQRAITPKVDKTALRFISSACRLIMLYICVKFHENISDGIRVMKRTRMMDAQMDGHTKFWMV